MNITRASAILGIVITLAGCGHDAARAKRALLQKGEQFYQKGSYGDAEIQFRKALQEDPRFGDAYLWLGRTEKQRGNFAGAFEALGQAVELQAGGDAPKIELVNLCLLAYLGDAKRPAALHDRIYQLSEELLAKNQQSFDGMRIKGFLALTDRKAAEAVDFFQQADRIKPDEPDVITALVESLILDNRAAQAEQTAHNFLGSHPACGPLYTVLYQHYMDTHRAGEAEAVLKSKVAGNPKESLYRIELARHYARVGKLQDVAQTLNPMLSAPREFPDAHLEVGDFYMEAGNMAEARQQYEQGLQTGSKLKAPYWKRLVRLDLAAGDRADAQQFLERILKEQPDDAEAIASRAALRMDGHDPEQKKLAATEFQALVARFPANVDYRFQYAKALLFTADTEGARTQYLSLLERQPANLAALQALAEISIREQHLEDALRYANRVLAIDSDNVPARLVLSAALAAQNRFEETRSVLTQLLRQHPELLEAQMQMALLDVEQKHYPDAEKRFRKYYEPGKGDTRALQGLVELYRAQGQTPRAIALLQQDLVKRPQSGAVRVLLARLAAQAGQYDLAIAQYQQLAGAEANSPSIAMELGLAYQAKHDPVHAVAQFEKARAMSPQDPLVYAYLGQALDEAGRKPEAIASYRRSLSLDSRNPWVMNNLAYLLADTGGDFNEALKLAQDATQQNPGNVSFSDTVGLVYLKKGSFAAAVHVFSAARDKSPKNITFRIHLAMALLASGDRNQGRLELTDAQQLPHTPEEKETMGRLLAQSAK